MTQIEKRDLHSYAVMSAAMEAHRYLGQGFLESVYQEALEPEFQMQEIPYEREAALHIAYKGKSLLSQYRVDFVCYGSMIVELKALRGISEVEEARIINYLKASGFQVGLLLNLGRTSLEYRRFANTPSA